MKKFEVSPGSKIKIELSRNKPQNKNSEKIVPYKNKGIIRSRRDPDYLPRRIRKGAGINFYDLAQLKNLETNLFEDVEVNLDYDVETADALEILNSALEIPASEWKNRFKKIERVDAEKYRFAIYINDAEDAEIISENNRNLTANGLKIIFQRSLVFASSVLNLKTTKLFFMNRI